ncbi:nitrite/sulfite reductase [Caldimonas thermodepolymerans]|uniref:Nitrite reductase n=1 Tax=Caldimonas thermodepolymerans TaxID=215580 RepID=A0A2S5T705_9BURK|nr:nitrite/sulfite reductase [Caldimonas thermodepolymerans]PPE70761.1 nitrite reductase [Caldimonas thermodepolymerans]QPC32976.1 nitrite/sulfite reductase [Caldimonas thermodepolymerans]RDI03759.1 sulfite reductase (NADPH) hemoprotein beta-component [Caldimonas thermodepolymerans]TCP09726.1 sulfite reductase (NADPH) hemoprotein beta-component [Caldimonas thermodepolymerans]UZG45844.1 nitrite/sulfite reductase [Caldimonas thermodepolymerans]
MYQYNEFDQQFVRQRAAQFRDQLERWQRGELTDEQLLPLRLQNGWYIQRYAPMARIAVPYGEINSKQLRMLARIAREYDRPDPELLAHAQATQDALQAAQPGQKLAAPRLKYGYGHFTTRTNVQFNWIPLAKAAEVMELLASVNMHGIQTSGNAIRNITCEADAGIADDTIVDVRPFAEIARQWSTLHPEFAFLPRKFKIAFNGAREDRAATGWYDIGVQAVRTDDGEVGFKVRVGGGMGRTPVIGTVVREFLPWHQLLNYFEAVIRVYNGYGRRDNKWKARIKILVKAEGQRFIDAVEAEYKAIVEQDGAPHTITQAELDRVQAGFAVPELKPANLPSKVDTNGLLYQRWLKQNVRNHRLPGLKAVTLSFKRVGFAPGDADADTLDALAQLAEQFSAGEARLTHEQNLLLPWVHESDLPALYETARSLGLATPNIGLLTDMIACPGGDFCSLANARSLPIAAAITERYQDLDELFDLGPIDLHMSGCINSCGHHHSGHIGILGVDKDGMEWYQITLGGTDGSDLSGPAQPGKVVGPSFRADEVPDAIEAILEVYRELRQPGELFIDTLRRVGHDPFKAAANGARHARTEHLAAA